MKRGAWLAGAVVGVGLAGAAAAQNPVMPTVVTVSAAEPQFAPAPPAAPVFVPAAPAFLQTQYAPAAAPPVAGVAPQAFAPIIVPPPAAPVMPAQATAPAPVPAAPGLTVETVPPATGPSGLVLPDSPGGAVQTNPGTPPDLIPNPNPGDAPAPLGTVGGPTPGTPDPEMSARWNNGVFLESANKDFVAHVGGVFQFDALWYDAQVSQRYPGGTGAFNDAVDIRRARIRTEGTMYHSLDWVFEVDFAAAGFNPTAQPATITNTFWAPAPTDMWVQIKEVPFVGTVRIGQQKEPFSLDRLNSARLLNFMERSFLSDASQASAFNNNRSPGVSVFRNFAADDRVYTSVGVFKNVGDLYGYGIGDGQYAVTGRVTGLPIWNEGEKYFWHVGGAMSHRDPVNGSVQLRVRPDIRVNPLPFVNVIANTGLLPADSQDLYGIETAAVVRSFTFQSEYQAYVLNGVTNPAINRRIGNVVFQGYYAEALYFLTGESRPFNRKAAVFGRVSPNNPLILEHGHAKGLGAFEVSARVQHLSLNDKSIGGGQLNACTLGLNWYWNANTRMQFNYDYTYRDKTATVDDLGRNIIHSFGTRMQYDF